MKVTDLFTNITVFDDIHTGFSCIDSGTAHFGTFLQIESFLVTQHQISAVDIIKFRNRTEEVIPPVPQFWLHRKYAYYLQQEAFRERRHLHVCDL